jgi:hypothetical protein
VRPQPAARARGRALGERGDAEPALDDEEHAVLVERDPARCREIVRDWARGEAWGGDHRRAECEGTAGEALRLREGCEGRETDDGRAHGDGVDASESHLRAHLRC